MMSPTAPIVITEYTPIGITALTAVREGRDRRMSEINVCCPLFLVLPCGDTNAHQHIGCDAKAKLGDDPLITNEQAGEYCIGDEDSFKHCPYYPKYG